MTRREQLHFLIAALQKEMPEYAADALPEDEAAAFDLFRTLCNVRRPGVPKLPEAFYAVERDVLRAMTEAKGVTAGNPCRRSKPTHDCRCGRGTSRRSGRMPSSTPPTVRC